jgi:hypothetical protein
MSERDIVICADGNQAEVVEIRTPDEYDVVIISINIATAWGAISGTLASQTDLQEALDDKVSIDQGVVNEDKILSVDSDGEVSLVDVEHFVSTNLENLLGVDTDGKLIVLDDPTPPPDPIGPITDGVIPTNTGLQPSITHAPILSISTSQWRGEINWSPAIPVGNMFAENQVYTATIQVTPTPLFTFDGSTVTWSLDIVGSSVSWDDVNHILTITFPVTGTMPPQSDWEMTTVLPVMTTFNHINSQIPIRDFVGFDGTQVLTDDLYDIASQSDMPIRVFAQYVTDYPNWVEVMFDSFNPPPVGGNAIRSWGLNSLGDGGNGTIYFNGTNSTSEPVNIRIVQEL